METVAEQIKSIIDELDYLEKLLEEENSRPDYEDKQCDIADTEFTILWLQCDLRNLKKEWEESGSEMDF